MLRKLLTVANSGAVPMPGSCDIAGGDDDYKEGNAHPSEHEYAALALKVAAIIAVAGRC